MLIFQIFLILLSPAVQIGIASFIGTTKYPHRIAKLPTPNYTKAVCYKNEGCEPKYINSKIYIDDELYESMQRPYMRQNITKKLGM